MPETSDQGVNLYSTVNDVAANGKVQRTCWRRGDTVWRDWGAGRPVILLHGGFGSWTHWVRTVPAISTDRRVLVPDMPGFGDSDDPVMENALEAISRALLAGLEKLIDIEAGIDIVSFSFGTVVGGALAQLVNERYPTAVKNFVLVAPAGLGITTRVFNDLAFIRPGMTQVELRNLHRNNLGIIMLADKSMIADETIDIQIANTQRNRVSAKSYTGGDVVLAACRSVPMENLDVILGARDEYVARNEPDYSAALAKLHPKARIHCIEGGGHWVQYEKADAFNALLRQCLDIEL